MLLISEAAAAWPVSVSEPRLEAAEGAGEGVGSRPAAWRRFVCFWCKGRITVFVCFLFSFFVLFGPFWRWRDRQMPKNHYLFLLIHAFQNWTFASSVERFA